MRRDSSNSLSSSSSHCHHQCPVLSRLYLSVDGDVRICHDDDIGESNSVSDDVFLTHVNDDHRQRRLFHAWAQYRIAQRGIMVSQSLLLTIHYQCTVAFP